MTSSNLKLMGTRLEFQGGIKQEERMIKDKYKTFQKALIYSYQGVDTQIIQKYTKCEQLSDQSICRALINPDKTKQDYDDKIVSIDYASGLEPGDIFEWKNTATYWIVYLRALTEDSYFRGEIRRCRFKLKFRDAVGNPVETYVAIRGPVETAINSIQKNQVRVDEPNWSLNILMPRNEKTLAAFDRYKQFLFQGKCWRIEAVDSISMENIIELNAQEYYIDRDRDDVENELKDGLVVESVNPTPETLIEGPTFIKPKLEYSYSIYSPGGTWKAVLPPEDICPAPVTITLDGEQAIKVAWNKTTSGQFKLIWTFINADGETFTDEKLVVVESLF